MGEDYVENERISYSGFPAMLNVLSVGIVKMLLLVSKMRFVHRQLYEVADKTTAKNWSPDRLAAMGVEHGNAKIRIAQQVQTVHLLEWSNHKWDGPLLLSVDVRLKDVTKAL